MISHDRKRAELVMTQLGAAPQRSNDERGDGLMLKKPRPPLGPVKVTIHPDKGLPGRQVMQRWVLSPTQAPIQMPNQEWPSVLRVNVREVAMGYGKSVPERAKISRALLHVPPGVGTSDVARKSACATDTVRDPYT